MTADVIAYAPSTPRKLDRHRDAAASRLGLPRARARRVLAASLAGQAQWPASVVLGHNMPQLVPLVDTDHHVAVLYAHNELLRTYSAREAGRVLDAAGVIVCVSNYVADKTAERLPPRLRDRVAVVHNAVDTTVFRPAGTRSPDGALHVVFVGRMLPDKGPDVLVEALVRLAREDIFATFVGTTNFAPRAALTSFERGMRLAGEPLGDRAHWLPFQPRDKVAAIMRTADVVVVPSRWAEPFALTVLEGMASGAAVIASRVGGIPEAAGRAGILVSPDDPEALAQALEGLADDSRGLARVRTASLLHARANDWSTARTRLDQVLADRCLTTGALRAHDGTRGSTATAQPGPTTRSQSRPISRPVGTENTS
ncbi:glycosyltransferase family 4 protein [Isoptericola croceus]|uniref:glycosyltransferase family 4 protein n=1 Tax=Isoptericola croceus TaxID=3031406 RepID=UPI0023F6F1D2|nr:glycosyltransferase family 4 protein [Isoptericola croceus]